MGRKKRRGDGRMGRVVYHLSNGRTAEFEADEIELLIEAAVRRLGAPAMLAKLIGATRQTIHTWRIGSVVPDLAIQAILSRIAGVVKSG